MGLDLIKYSKYFLLALILIVGIASFNLISSFIGAIFGAIILSTIIYPLYIKINKKIKNKNLTAILTLIVLGLLIIIPGFFITTSLIKESISAYNFISNVDLSEVSDDLSKLTGIRINLDLYIKEELKNLTEFLLSSGDNTLLQLPTIMLYIFVILFIMFYLLRDGKKIATDIDKYIPLKKDQKNKIIKSLKETIDGIVYGTIITSLIQGVIGTIGFLIFGISNPILWGLMIFVTGILPVIGASAIYVPAAIYLAVTNSTTSGILFLLYGIFLISTVETFLRPKIIGKKTQIHPIIILLGLIGGIKIWGLIGIVLGPIILSILFTLIKMYEQMYIMEESAKLN